MILFLENYFCLSISLAACDYKQRVVWNDRSPMFMMAFSASGQWNEFLLSSYTLQ